MLEMEVTDLYENLGFWEKDLGLPEVTWADGLNRQEEVKHESELEGDSFWKDADFPLKEANKNKVNDPLIDDTFDFSQDLMGDDWLDERIDIGAALESFIYSPEFEDVFNDLSEAENYLKGVNEVSSTTSKENLSADLSIGSKSSEVELDIGINEGSLDGNTIYYLNPCEMSSPSTLDSDNIHYVISPSIFKANEEIVESENLDAHYIQVNVLSENEDSQHFEGKMLSEISQSCSSTASSEASCPLKSRRGRRKLRVKPYKDTSDDSCTSGSSSNNSFSAPGSPLVSDVGKEMVRGSTTKKRERKKYQNRNAATKYRQKKREQTEAISSEEQDLENKNKELKGKVDQLSNEVGYLKKLMREILIAKGLLKK